MSTAPVSVWFLPNLEARIKPHGDKFKFVILYNGEFAEENVLPTFHAALAQTSEALHSLGLSNEAAETLVEILDHTASIAVLKGGRQCATVKAYAGATP